MLRCVCECNVCAGFNKQLAAVFVRVCRVRVNVRVMCVYVWLCCWMPGVVSICAGYIGGADLWVYVSADVCVCCAAALYMLLLHVCACVLPCCACAAAAAAGVWWMAGSSWRMGSPTAPYGGWGVPDRGGGG